MTASKWPFTLLCTLLTQERVVPFCPLSTSALVARPVPCTATYRLGSEYLRVLEHRT